MTPIHIGDWIKSGCPKDIWFYVIRQSRLDDCTEDTPKILTRLIELSLEQYGKYETSKPKVITIFNPSVIYWLDSDYAMYHTTGNVNGKQVPVVAVRVEAKIIDE